MTFKAVKNIKTGLKSLKISILMVFITFSIISNRKLNKIFDPKIYKGYPFGLLKKINV